MNAPVYLVGLAGPAGVGKSTVARELCKLGDWTNLPTFRRQRFAGPLKAMLRALGLTEAQVDGDEKELPCELLGGLTPRRAMQSLGTEWGRDCIDPNLWVRATMLRVAEDFARGFATVIDDVRFDNEARAIAGRGGIIVKLSRHDVQADDSHASERGLTGELIDYVIPNNGTPDSTAREVAWLLRNRTQQ